MANAAMQHDGSRAERGSSFWSKSFKVARPNGEDEAIFCFADEVWPLQDVLRPHEISSAATISFINVPSWLRDDAKRYVAELWSNSYVTANKLQVTMVAIRFLGKALPDFTGRPIELRMTHAREVARRLCEFKYSPSHNKGMQSYINKFMAFVRRQHPEETTNDFKIVLPKGMLTRPRFALVDAEQKIVPTEIQAKIIDACLADIRAYQEAKKTYIDPIENKVLYEEERYRRIKAGEPTYLLPKLPNDKPRMSHLLGRAVKATSVLLMICVGRRAAAVCNTRLDVRTEEVEWVNEAGQIEWGVTVRFEEFKISKAYEDVFCPDAFGRLAFYAI